MEAFSLWHGWSWSSSAEEDAWQLLEVWWTCRGLRRAQHFCSSSADTLPGLWARWQGAARAWEAAGSRSCAEPWWFVNTSVRQGW